MVAHASSSTTRAAEAPAKKKLEIPNDPRDKRGEGEIIEGKKIRGYKGSTRLPGWTTEEWKFCIASEQKETTAQYLTILYMLQEKYRKQLEEADPEPKRGLDSNGGDITLKELQALKEATNPSIAVAQVAQRFGSGMKTDTKSEEPQGDYWENR